MAFFLKDVNKGLSVLMAALFVMFYFTINLSLLKYIFHLLDDEENDVSIVSTLPTRQQIIRFLVAMCYFMLCICRGLPVGDPDWFPFHLYRPENVYRYQCGYFDRYCRYFYYLGEDLLFPVFYY